MTDTVTTYAEADALLGSRTSRKVANNTYLQRRAADTIAVKLHDTDVVTYEARVPWSSGETITLNAGGWYTQTTRDRIDSFTPQVIQAFSVKGRWWVTRQRSDKPTVAPSFDPRDVVPFADGIRLIEVGEYLYRADRYPDPDEVERQDRHNRTINKLLDAYLRAHAKNELTPNLCGMCTRISLGVMAGDHFDYPQHLMEHLVNKEWNPSMVRVAKDVHGEDTQRAVRAYLRNRLYVGAVTTAHGRKPVVLPPTAMEA